MNEVSPEKGPFQKERLGKASKPSFFTDYVSLAGGYTTQLYKDCNKPTRINVPGSAKGFVAVAQGWAFQDCILKRVGIPRIPKYLIVSGPFPGWEDDLIYVYIHIIDL